MSDRELEKLNRQYAPTPQFTWVGMLAMLVLGFAIGVLAV